MSFSALLSWATFVSVFACTRPLHDNLEEGQSEVHVCAIIEDVSHYPLLDNKHLVVAGRVWSYVLCKVRR